MRNRLAKFVLTVAGLIFVSQTHAQKIEIGQSADQIKELVEWTTKEHNTPDTNGNSSSSYWTWDVKYNNGEIIDVSQCYQKQYLIDVGVISDYCKHYIMVDNKLVSILTQFENIPIEKVIENYNNNSNYNKIGNLYFSDDYEHFSKIYLSNTGLVNIEWRRTIVSELPTSIQKTVTQKLTTLRSEAKNQQEIELNTEQTREAADSIERQNTLLSCENFKEGFALVCIDSEHKSGEMNYGYGKKLYGFMNEKGEFIVYPKYEKAAPFSNGFALVASISEYSKSWKFINEKGVNVFNKEFDEARSFSEGLAAVQNENGVYGFIDLTGNFISTPQYEEVGDFKEGLARVKFQDKWGYIDKTGKEIVLAQFTGARDFSDGLALVSQHIGYQSTAYSYINKTGSIALKLSEGDTPTLKLDISCSSDSRESRDYKMEIPLCDFNNGLAMITKSSAVSFGFGGGGNVFIDKTGKIVIRPKSGSLNCPNFNFYQYVNDYSIAELCRRFGFLDKKGKWFIKPIFEDVGNFNEGLAKVKLNDNWGFVDVTGNVVINKDILKAKTEIKTNPPYDAVSDFSEGLAIVRTREKLGFIDKSGDWVIKPVLVAATPFKNGIARVIFANKKGWNYIDKNGKILFTNFL